MVNGYRIQTHNKVYYLHTKRSKILNGLGATTNSLPTTNIQPTTANMKGKNGNQPATTSPVITHLKFDGIFFRYPREGKKKQPTNLSI